MKWRERATSQRQRLEWDDDVDEDDGKRDRRSVLSLYIQFHVLRMLGILVQYIEIVICTLKMVAVGSHLAVIHSVFNPY